MNDMIPSLSVTAADRKRASSYMSQVRKASPSMETMQTMLEWALQHQYRLERELDKSTVALATEKKTKDAFKSSLNIASKALEIKERLNEALRERIRELEGKSEAVV